MLVLHANWMANGSDAALQLWGESQPAYLAHLQQTEPVPHADVGAASATAAAAAPGFSSSAAPTTSTAPTASTPLISQHPFTVDAVHLQQQLNMTGLMVSSDALRLRLPADDIGPMPSDRLARRVGEFDRASEPSLGEFTVPSVIVPHHLALDALMQLKREQHQRRELDFGQSLRYWMAVADTVLGLLANQRFIPTLMQVRDNGFKAAWQPWVQDDEVRRRIGLLLHAMPATARAAVDQHQHRPWPILEQALRQWTDAFVRHTLEAEQFIDAIEGRKPADDPHAAWLTGLLGSSNQVHIGSEAGMSLLRDVEIWVGRLDDAQQRRPLRLCLKLQEPDLVHGQSPDQSMWMLTFHLQSPDQPALLYDAREIWSNGSAGAAGAAAGPAALPAEKRGTQAQEILLAELGRASRVYPPLEQALTHKHPVSLQLSTSQAYEFLREGQALLTESGVSVILPTWWNQPIGRLAARLHVEAPSVDELAQQQGNSPTISALGLNSIVKFNWQLAIGDQPLSMEEFQALTRQDSPLVQMRGRWVEISPEQLAEARDFLEQTPSGEMTLLQAIHLAHGAEAHMRGLAVHGMDATGWVADLLGASTEDFRMPLLDQPKDFHGTLRPYQKTGLSWLAFLDRFGLGACLADDMGLGKTIQLIALLLHERQTNALTSETNSACNSEILGQTPPESRIGPTLLIVPTSVIANWVRELQRFAPSLKAHVHHGPERLTGEAFQQHALRHDVVITTYPLVSRDQETLQRVHWHRVALDEAQYIKNPPTKQTTAIRSLHAPRRMALTGTPVENRLSELWSIMEFCNPGYFGPAAEFRRRFAIPIERHHNRLQAERLRQMVRPFVLRRVKTDPKIIDDLPPLTETKEFATLTLEQATMYQQAVDAMLRDVDRSEGIQRRGLVLATLVKLKQICNHPEQARSQQHKPAGVRIDSEKTRRSTHVSTDERNANVRDAVGSQAQDAENDNVDFANLDAGVAQLSTRSGKAKRLMTMLEEVIASGEKALIFTQFRQMGHLLTAMIQNDLDCEALFLHGGTPANKRQHLIDRFQDPSGGAPIFVLSLKAGGLGLNLTAANHVFHYDRWWNPAVENQATDRAFRIGQVRAVQVHKFVCLGTLEERIDHMIEQKTELAQNIIGSGEQWLTELSTSQLHDLLMLRPSAMEVES